MWSAIVRGTGLITVVALGLSLVWDDAATLAAFVLVTIWVHGPISPFLPVAYEPTLLHFGTLYAPLLIAALGTIGVTYVEFLDYQLMRRLNGTRTYQRIQSHRWFDRSVRLFERRPFFTTWLFAWSPLPFWMIRIVAPASGYPVGRFLLANALGRFPRFWLLAAIGARFRVPPGVLAGVFVVSALLMALGLLRARDKEQDARGKDKLVEAIC